MSKVWAFLQAYNSPKSQSLQVAEMSWKVLPTNHISLDMLSQLPFVCAFLSFPVSPQAAVRVWYCAKALWDIQALPACFIVRESFSIFQGYLLAMGLLGEKLVGLQSNRLTRCFESICDLH